MSKISVVINVVEGELDLISEAASSVKGFADEIVVVDMSHSGASLPGAKIYKHEFSPWVEPARNFGIEKASGDWIFILDPDERAPKSLTKKLKEIVEGDLADYVTIPRKNIIFGKWIINSRWWPDYSVWFFKKGKVTWGDEIHSVPQTTDRGLDLPAEEKYAIVHNHYVNVEQYIERMNRYTSVQAKEKIKEGYEFDWRDLIAKPTSEFLSRYFFGKAYKDGVHGLALSGLQAVSEFVIYLKTWSMKEKKVPVGKVIRQMRKSEKEFHYWQGDAIGGVVGRIKKKFRL